jgi:hypothetical protein
MVDVNETGGPQTINLDTLDIVRNFTAFSPASDPRNDPLSNDITSAQQNATNASFSGGTLLATLDSSPKVLHQVAVGAGHADQAIYIGINPFDAAFAASDRILFHWASSDHDNGGETIFLSGALAPQDVAVPEPAGVVTLVVAAALMSTRRSRCLSRTAYSTACATHSINKSLVQGRSIACEIARGRSDRFIRRILPRPDRLA